MKNEIVTIGGATEDIAIHTNECVLIDNKKDVLRQKLVGFEYGAKVKVNYAKSSFGGGAANVAVALSRLGFKTSALIAVGDDERGTRLLKNLAKENVNISLVQKIKNQLTGFSPIVVCPDNERITFSVRGANENLNITNEVLKKISDSKWLFITSLSGDKKNWIDNLNKIFSIKNVKIAWNPGHLQLDEGHKVLGRYLNNTELLIVNIDEARELIVSHSSYDKQEASILGNVNELLKIISSWGPKIVVITMGKEGAVAFDGKKIYKISANKKIKQVNTVGVGDSFGASIVAGLELYNYDITKAMNLGKINTSSVISKDGAQLGLIYKKDIYT